MMKAAISWVLSASMLFSSLAVPVVTAQDAGEGYVDFNFNQVELGILSRIVGEMTGNRFVLGDFGAEKLTVVTPEKISVSEVFPFFLSILESSGYSVVEKGGAFHVVKLESSDIPSGPVVSDEDGSQGGIITRIFKLKHVSAIELQKILVPMVRGGKKGSVQAFGSTNHLIITDTMETLKRIAGIIEEVDQSGQASVTEIVELEHASAEEVAKQLNATLDKAASAGEKLSRHMTQVTDGGANLPTRVGIVPVPHSNRLILIGNSVQLGEMKRLIAAMDVEPRVDGGRLNAIFLKYLPAEDAAKSLNALLEKAQGQAGSRAISIEPSTANNALLVEAAPQDYEIVRALVEKLDTVPQQVLVEILVAEVAEGKSLDLGVELATIDQPGNDKTTVIGRSRPGSSDMLQGIFTNFIPQGLSFAVSKGTFTDASGNLLPRIPIIIRALAENRDVEILANVPLWAQNNREASVSVVDNIPVITSTVEGAGDARDVVQTIERIDVGIKLTLTPQVNPQGEVLLNLNPVIEAIVDTGSIEGNLAPTIAKREVATTVTIPDKATVVISGLIREDKIDGESKIPILGDIPLLGFLFRSTTTQKQRTNLMIFVTPSIVTDLDNAEKARSKIEGRAGISLSEIEADLDASQPEKKK